MPEFDQQAESQHQAVEAKVSGTPTPAEIHQLVVRTGGHPAKLAHLLRKVSSSAEVRKLVLGEAQRLFGNQFVQEALKLEARQTAHGHEGVTGGGED
jgi:hypothetical protein